MQIEFHCSKCGKLVRTASEHAGKRGRCPSCHQSIYIPTPSEEIEPLELEPLDKSAEREQEQLMRETRELTMKILGEKEKPLDTGPESPADSAQDMLPPRMDIETLVIEYALSMADGDLPQAEELANEIRMNMSAAEEFMQRLTLDEIPHPQLARIPRPVLIGFFKQLREGQ
jgi:hypothetical protein